MEAVAGAVAQRRPEGDVRARSVDPSRTWPGDRIDVDLEAVVVRGSGDLGDRDRPRARLERPRKAESSGLGLDLEGVAAIDRVADLDQPFLHEAGRTVAVGRRDAVVGPLDRAVAPDEEPVRRALAVGAPERG